MGYPRGWVGYPGGRVSQRCSRICDLSHDECDATYVSHMKDVQHVFKMFAMQLIETESNGLKADLLLLSHDTSEPMVMFVICTPSMVCIPDSSNDLTSDSRILLPE